MLLHARKYVIILGEFHESRSFYMLVILSGYYLFDCNTIYKIRKRKISIKKLKSQQTYVANILWYDLLLCLIFSLIIIVTWTRLPRKVKSSSNSGQNIFSVLGPKASYISSYARFLKRDRRSQTSKSIFSNSTNHFLVKASLSPVTTTGTRLQSSHSPSSPWTKELFF